MEFPKNYSCVPDFIESNNNQIKITPLRFEHRLDILKWRNEQLFHLRQKELITKKKQHKYFNNILRPLFYQDHPSQLLFSIFLDNKFIGYGGLVHINWIDKYCELSFLVETSILEKHEDVNELNDRNLDYKLIFSEFISCMKEIVFKHLKFNRLFTETYCLRKNHIKILEINKFKFEGIQRQKIFMNKKFIDSLYHSIIKSDEK